jgi:hypothetical protein
MPHDPAENRNADAQAAAYFSVLGAGFSCRVLLPLMSELAPTSIDLIRSQYAELGGCARKPSFGPVENTSAEPGRDEPLPHDVRLIRQPG